MPVCKAAFSKTPDFQWSASKFLNYMKHDFKKSFKDFDAGVNAYEHGDFEKTGETIARIFQKMDSHKELAVADEKINGNMAMDVAEVAQGFLKGANLGEFSFTQLLECIMVADKTAIFAYQDVELAMEAWKKKDWQEAMGAAITAVGVYQGVQQSLQICSQVDMRLPINLKKDFTINPLAFAKQEVQDKLQEAYKANEANKLYDFGKDIGEAIAMAEDKNMFIF